MMHFGVVGTGWITEALINGAALFPQELQLTAVCSRDRERGKAFAERMGAKRVYTSPKEMAEDANIDAVYVASPNACHGEQVRIFLAHGKHVLCEKPLSADPEEVFDLQQIASAQGLLYREAIMMLYQPAWSVLREAVRQIGSVSTAQFQFCQLSSKYEALCKGEIPNIFNPVLHTGALMDLGIYCVYPALALFGEPRSLSAHSSFLSTGADAAGGALFNYDDKTVILSYSKVGQGSGESEIIGDRGSITIGSISRLADITLHLNGQPPKKLVGSDEKPLLMGREILSFARSVAAGERMGTEKDRLALSVSRRLKDIRLIAGIQFPSG